MRFIDSLCPPALLYLLYITVHVGLDLSLGLFLTAAAKVLMGVAGVVILDAGVVAASTTGSPTLSGTIYTFTGSGTITF